MIKVILGLLALFFLIACGASKKNSNNISTETLSVYRKSLYAGDYNKAEYNLNHNSFYTTKKHGILLNLELGKLYHLRKKYDSSNVFFNNADIGMEDSKKYSYDGSQIDKVLVHYYKALNYLYLGNNDEALVEARRINLKINEMSEKRMFRDEARIDPFAQVLQGVIYEKMGNYDDALLSYKDAVALYDKYGMNGYLGVNIPNQLIADVINIANKAGRINERDFYCEKFNVSYNDVKDTSTNNVLFFWENGISTVKKHQQFNLNLVKTNVINMFAFSKEANVQIPLSISFADAKELASSNINRISVSYYVSVEPVSVYNSMSVISNEHNYQTTVAENIAQRMHISPLSYSELEGSINSLITEELRRRRTERAANKKKAEEDLQKKYKAVDEARKKAELELAALKSEDERAKKIKEMDIAKKKADSDIANLKRQIANPTCSSNSSSLNYNRNTGSSDTRSWQSLPSTIAYSKIPVTNNQTKVIVNLNSTVGNSKIDTIVVNPNVKLNVLNYTTMDHLPYDYDAFVPILK